MKPDAMAPPVRPAARAARAPKATRGPRGPRAEGDSRAEILAAARALFAQRGFRATTTRQVAERAGVDIALIHHFFGTKAGLFEAAIDVQRIGGQLHTALTAPPGGDVAEAVARLYLDRLFAHDLDTFTAVLRTVVGGDEELPWLRGLFADRMLGVARQAFGPGSELRAEIVAAQMVGLLVLRYILQVEPIASASTDEIVERLAPGLRAVMQTEAGE
ncbi:MAG: TetR family transcriptional regulator [Dehalococcoidia bacterium]